MYSIKFHGVDVMKGAKSVDIKKMAVLIVILLLIFAGQAEGKGGGIVVPANITAETFGSGGQAAPTCKWGGGGGCHDLAGGASDTITISHNVTGELSPGDHINITITTETLYAIAAGEGIGVMLLNDTYENPMELYVPSLIAMDYGEGWKIISSPSGTRNNFHQQFAIGTGPTNWEWILEAPSTAVTTTFLAVMRWDAGGTGNKADSRKNVSTLGWVTVNVGVPEFPYEALALILPLFLYAEFRRRIPPI